MPSEAYNSLLVLSSKYLDEKRAAEILQRQLTNCALSTEMVTADQIKANSSRFSIALGLYVADKAKRDELAAKIATI